MCLHKSVLQEAQLHLNEELEVAVRNGSVTLSPVRARTVTIPDFAAMFADYHGSVAQEDIFAVHPMGRNGELPLWRCGLDGFRRPRED